MSIELLTGAMLGGILGLLALGVPLAFVTGSVAMATGLILFGPGVLPLIATRTFTLMNQFVLVAVPMFVFMASILERSGVAQDLFKAMHVIAGGLRGGLALQTMFAAVLLASMTGIIGGEIVLLGLIALPQMLNRKYDRKLSIGTICAGGSLGSMIPPSIVLIVFGLTANVAIGRLFIGSVIPGLLLAGLYVVYIMTRCYLNPALGPAAPIEERQAPLVEKLVLLRGLILPIALAVIVLGSIYGGIASVGEAAAVGAAGSIVTAGIRRELTWRMIRGSLHQTMSTCGMLMWLFFSANALIGVYNLMGGTRFIQNLISGLPLDPIGIVLVMMATMFVLGLFMDWIGIVFLTIPIFIPTIVKLGMDPIWFGVLFCMNMQIAFLTPPFGQAAFFLKGVAPADISLKDIFNSLWPFIGLQITGLLIVVSFPEVALWLPRLFYG